MSKLIYSRLLTGQSSALPIILCFTSSNAYYYDLQCNA